MVERVGFARGERVEKSDDFYLPEAALEWIGLKKSEYLSTLIQHLEEDDFKFEEYHEYDSFIPATLERADSVYELVDEDYPVRVFIKSHVQASPFHQVVIGAVVSEENGDAEIFVPILVFVTKSEKLLRVFSVGHQKNRPTLN